MSQQDHIAAHKRCSYHRQELAATKTCGCFYCLEVYDPALIREWTDRKQTAVCPKCGIDSVIPESADLKVTVEFLQKMHDHWFADAEHADAN